ncbi:hypothetical protein RI367_002945 [Sorochytrium milnesiophthora]
MRSLTLRDVPIDILERVCHFLREETCVLLAIALDNAALDSVLLKTNIPLTLWQSTNHSTVQWLVKCNASGASLWSWMTAAEYGWVDVIAHLHKHHGVWCTPQVMDCAAMYNNMDVVRFLARHRTEMCTTAALQHIAKHGTPADWHLLVTADLQWFREEFLDVVGPHLLPATFLALYLKSGQLAEPELVRQAARAGRLDLIKLFHKRERRSTFSTKVLKAAVYSGNLELVKYLHNHKLGRFTHSAIAVAARDKNVNLVRYLVDIVPESRRLYYDPDNPTDVNVTVAMYLTNTDVTEKMKRRLRRHVPEPPSDPIADILAGAIKYSGWDVPRLLKCQPDLTGRDMIAEAVETGYDLEVIQTLHALGAVCTPKLWSSHWHIPQSIDSIKFLLSVGVDGGTAQVMTFAAMNGNLELVQFLHNHYSEGCTTDAMDEAAANNYLDIVQFLHIHRSEGCTTKAMDSAASWGSLEMVTFLHENRTEGCTTLAMDRAAQNGYLEVVEFLHRNRTEGCTTDAMDNAAHHRHWDIVQFLHIHRSEGCTTKAMDSAASWGSLEMVTFLHENRTEGCTTLAMDRAAQNGYLEVVEFLHRNRTEGCTTNAVESAVRNKHLSVVQFFHASRNISCSVGALEFALQYGRSDPYDVVEWVLRNRTVEYGPRLMDLAARHGHLRVVELLHSIDTGGCTTDAMDDAAQNGHLKIVEFLHHNRSEGCTLRAMTDAATNGHLEIVKFLHHRRLEGCDADTMSRAGANGHLDVVKFLAFNRSGGAVVDTAMRAIKGYCFWHPEILHFLHRQGPELRLNSVLATPLSAYDERSALITYVYHRGHKVHVDNDLFTTAAQRGVYSDVKLMYECGIGTDLHSALRQAREQGHRQIARYLELAMRAQQ